MTIAALVVSVLALAFDVAIVVVALAMRRSVMRSMSSLFTLPTFPAPVNTVEVSKTDTPQSPSS